RQGSSRRRSKRKKWYNRWPVRIAAALLLLIAGAAAFGAWRLDKTMGNLNAVSTLPAQIQDQTAQDVDGSPVPLVTIVLPTRNPDAPAPTVVIPHYEGASPGGPARQTAIAVVQEPQPTFTPQATTEA